MSKVTIEQSGPVKTIWMNRAEKRNALDRDMGCELTELLRAAVAPDDRVVVIRGKGGDVFCSGPDMAERRATAETGEASGIEDMLWAIELCPLPVVAVVQGDARDCRRERTRTALRSRRGPQKARRLPRSASPRTGSWPRS